jgi:hypothetical protein
MKKNNRYIQNLGREPEGERQSWNPTVYDREISNGDLKKQDVIMWTEFSMARSKCEHF